MRGLNKLKLGKIYLKQKRSLYLGGVYILIRKKQGLKKVQKKVKKRKSIL